MDIPSIELVPKLAPVSPSADGIEYRPNLVRVYDIHELVRKEREFCLSLRVAHRLRGA